VQKRTEFTLSPKGDFGTGWYRAQDYPRILEIMSDRDTLHEHYGDWLSSAEEGEARLIGEGLDVARVLVEQIRFGAGAA
jgi:hypothetical protein